MKISTRGRYALRLMIDLAMNQEGDPVRIKDVATRQDISAKYLEQIVPMLHRSNFLRTNRGYQGGYRLARAPREYTVREILELTEGGLAPVSCLEGDAARCERSEFCATLPMWRGLQQVIETYLQSITLQDLLEQQQERYANNYVI